MQKLLRIFLSAMGRTTIGDLIMIMSFIRDVLKLYYIMYPGQKLFHAGLAVGKQQASFEACDQILKTLISRSNF